MDSHPSAAPANVNDNLGQMAGLGAMAFVLFLSSLVGLPVLPALARELGAGATGAAFVVSSALATAVIVQFFAGILADRYSKRRVVLVGALMGSASSLLCVVATHWTQLAALRVIGGVADAIAMPALLAITASLGKDAPGKFFGILRGSQGLSFVVGPSLGGLCSLISLRAPFAIDGLLSLLAFFAAWRFLKGSEKAKSDHDIRSLIGHLRSTFSSPRVYLFLLMGVTGLFGFGVLSNFVPIKADVLGLKAWQIGLILTGGALCFTGVSFVVGHASDRFGRRRFAVASQALIVLGCAGLACSNSFVPMAISYGIFCVGEATTFLLSFVYAAEVFSKKHIGASMGAFDSVMDLSLVVAPLLAISLHRASGSFPVVIMLAAVPAVLALFALSAWLPGDSQAGENALATSEESSETA